MKVALPKKRTPTCIRVAGISIRKKVSPQEVMKRALRLSEEPRAKNDWEKVQKLEKLERDLSHTLKILEPEFGGTNEFAYLEGKRRRAFSNAITLRHKLIKLRAMQKERKARKS